MKLHNHYFLVRHGQALSNVNKIISCWPEKKLMPLTKKGIRQIERAVKKLKKHKIDLIISSDILRAKQSAEVIGKELKIKPQYDKRLREYNIGVFNGASTNEYKSKFKNTLERFKNKPKGGETYEEIGKRVIYFLKDQEKRYKGKNIVAVSHQVAISMLLAKSEKLSSKITVEKYFGDNRVKNGEIRELHER